MENFQALNEGENGKKRMKKKQDNSQKGEKGKSTAFAVCLDRVFSSREDFVKALY